MVENTDGRGTPTPRDASALPPTTRRGAVEVRVDHRSLWRGAWVVVAVVALAALGRWVVADGGTVIFTLVMSMFAAMALEPAVTRLSRRMRRGLATVLVMAALLVFATVFLASFGGLLAEQVATLARTLPRFVRDAARWAGERTGRTVDVDALLEGLRPGTDEMAGLAQWLVGGLLGVVAAILGAAFSTLTFAFFTYYFSADQLRLRRWVAQLAPPRQQEVITTVWQLAVTKTGGYVAARLVLAAVCGALSSLFMLVIGMPSWLALGIWTGLVAQFVPTVGTYIAIALPVLVGLTGDRPWQGLAMLVFALVYQQVENLTLEPRISAQAVDVHPAVSFGAVMLGAALFGVAGAFVAVPVASLVVALLEIYARKYEVLPMTPEVGSGPTAGARATPARSGHTPRRRLRAGSAKE